MKLPMSLAKSFQKMVLMLLTVIPLLTLIPASQAAESDEVEFSQAELDQMLAPIALYPDAMLSQVLIASTYPLEVIQADRWVRSNKDLKTEDALKFAENKDWDPSVKALVAFPDILKRMSDNVDWTQRLGDAFLNDEEAVMDAVQRLRKRAYANGNLDKAQHISVEEDDDVITIEPAEERIVYVPVYDTRVVYGNWWWPDYPPVYWNYPSSYTYTSGFYWGPSIFLGPTYFYSSMHWRDRRVVVIDRHHYVGSPRFYTGRSIVHYQGSRAWRHDPVHRHGVAYYNNNLRTTYGSRHESYQNDRNYRQQYRGNSGNQNPRINRDVVRDDKRPNTIGPERDRNDGNLPHRFDRADQVRERLNRDDKDARPWRGPLNARPENNTNGARSHWQNQQPVQQTGQQPLRAGDNKSPALIAPAESERNRAVMGQHRQPGAVEVNRDNRFSPDNRGQGNRIDSDGGHRRPAFSAPVQRAQEQPASVNIPQPTVQRQEAPGRTEFSQPRNEGNNRIQQQQQPERSHTPRFSRDRNDNNNK